MLISTDPVVRFVFPSALLRIPFKPSSSSEESISRGRHPTRPLSSVLPTAGRCAFGGAGVWTAVQAPALVPRCALAQAPASSLLFDRVR